MHNTTLILFLAMAAATAACTGNGGLSGQSGSKKRGSGTNSASGSEFGSADTNGGRDEEINVEPTLEAASVTGSFLSCGPAADAGDLGDKLPFGCVFRDPKTRVKLKVTPGVPVASIKLGAGTTYAPTMALATAASPWHFHFGVPQAVAADAVSMTVRAKFGATSVTKSTTNMAEAPDSGVAAGGDSSATLPPDAIAGAYYFFVTSNVYTGAEVGGIAGADKICNDAAKLANKAGRKWQSFLEGEGDGSDRSAVGTPLLNIMNEPLALTFDKVKLSSFDASVLSESGLDASAPDPKVWTGVLVDGSKATCEDWQGTSGQGGVGTLLPTATENSWMNAGSEFCAVPHHIYCVSL